MNRKEVKTGMIMWNHFYDQRRLLYIIESNEKYTECLRINQKETKIFKTGKDWDHSMQNYRVVTEDIFFGLLFGDLNE